MTSRVPYGQGTRMLALSELCEWLNITERHARKLVERRAIPYRKVGYLLRFAEQEVEEWSRPTATLPALSRKCSRTVLSAMPRPRTIPALPKSLIEPEDGHAQKRAS
jgi:excisionase family DNA binding protein